AGIRFSSYAILCLVKRSWALQRCNPTRDSQVRRENSSRDARGANASGVSLFLETILLPCHASENLSCHEDLMWRRLHRFADAHDVSYRRTAEDPCGPGRA